MEPSYSDINYFLEIAKTGNITRAAERLGVTQPSLSLALNRLEDAVGAQLLIRSRSGAELTRQGKEFEKKSLNFIREWTELKQDISDSKNQVEGRFTIGCHPSVCQYTAPYFMARLLEGYPKLNFNFDHDLSRNITEKVISFKLDFGIVVNPVRHPDLVIIEICKDEVAFWASKNKTDLQKLSNKNKVLICDENLLQVKDLKNKLKKKKIQFERYMHSSNLDVVAQLTYSGLGIGILPTRVVNQNFKGKLKRASGELPVFSDRICLIYRADYQKSMASKVIVEAIRGGSY